MKGPFANLDAGTIDEQIEESLHSHSYQQGNEDVRCLQDLQYLYHKDQILARARTRLMLPDQAAEIPTRSDQMETANITWKERNTFSSQLQPPAGRKAFSWSRIAAVLAAALLVIGAAIGASQFFRAAHQPGPGQSGKGRLTTSTATPNSTILLSDPLSSNTHGWIVDAHKHFHDGAYHIISDGETAQAAVLPAFTFTPPYSYTLTMTEVRGDVSSSVNTFGMIFAYTRTNTVIRFYSVEITNGPGGSELTLWKYDNGSKASPWTSLWHSAQASQPALGQAKTLKVVITASTLTFTLNGQTSGAAHVSVSKGQVGMLVNLRGSDVAFQNLVVTRP